MRFCIRFRFSVWMYVWALLFSRSLSLSFVFCMHMRIYFLFQVSDSVHVFQFLFVVFAIAFKASDFPFIVHCMRNGKCQIELKAMRWKKNTKNNCRKSGRGKASIRFSLCFVLKFLNSLCTFSFLLLRRIDDWNAIVDSSSNRKQLIADSQTIVLEVFNG